MKLIQYNSSDTPIPMLWLLAIVVAISLLVFLLTKGEESNPERRIEDLFKRACEVSHGCWFVHSIQDALNDGLFVILKNDSFPYFQEELDVPSSHPDFSGFESLQEGDYVSLLATREVNGDLPQDRLSTFLRLVGLVKAA